MFPVILLIFLFDALKAEIGTLSLRSLLGEDLTVRGIF